MRRARPQRKLRVAVLAGDVGVHVLHGHAAVPGNQEPKPRAVQHGARSEDPLPRQARQADRHLRNNIHWIRHQQQQRIRRNLHHLRQQSGADVRIGLRQVHPRLARLLLRTGRHDDHVRPAQHLNVVRAFDDPLRNKQHAVVQIQHLGIHLGLCNVKQAYLPRNAANHRRIGDRRSHAARSNNSNFCRPISRHFIDLST